MKVSVFCLAYNHEKYIRKTLEGFVMQKTSFPFEVLIHDDASTDNTAAIIKEYEEKYPDIIKPIYQTENQYSKGVKIIRGILLPQAKGEYFAFCEGDDYWCAPNKLQKQFDFLEKNPDYAICVHSANYNDIKNNITIKCPDISEDCDYTADNIIRYGGDIFATNSVMIRKTVYINRPDVFLAKGFGDYQMFMHGAIAGKCRCLSEIMSVYNFGTIGSWTQRIWDDKQKRLKHYDVLINLLKNIDEYYKGKYSTAINDKIKEITYQQHLLKKDYKFIFTDKYYRTLWLKQRKSIMLNIIKKYFPFLVAVKKFFEKLKGNCDGSNK